MYDERMTTETGDSPIQYCIDEDDHKQMAATFVQFSPTSSADWWSVLKTEDVSSPKDGWSSDSDSEHTIISGCSNNETSNMMIGLNDTTNVMMQEVNSTTMSLSESNNNNRNRANNNHNDSDNSNGGKSKKKKMKDTSAINKPAQVVARRNARERRRVQAVNWAFQRLRKVVPLEENKSKRMSKVKTLQLAIEYINQLQNLLQFTNQHTNEADLLADIFSDLQQQQHHQQQHDDQHIKLDGNEFSFRMPSFYTHLIDDENDEN